MKVYLSGKACCGAELCVFTCESEGMYRWVSGGTVRGHREVFPAACLLSTSHHLLRRLTLAGLAGPRPGASGVQAKLLCKGLHPGSLLSGTRSPAPPPKFLLCVSAPAFLSLTASTSPLVHLLFRKCSLSGLPGRHSLSVLTPAEGGRALGSFSLVCDSDVAPCHFLLQGFNESIQADGIAAGCGDRHIN